jgi:gamma-glutamyltranspeptidase / glutathione hydrolase
MRAAVAAGHPATVDAGIEILEEGGNAADAAVAASLASCVAETVMTGLLGGGHAAVFWAGEVRMLDFFVAVPGLGAERREVELVHLEVSFGAELVHYAVGIGSCAVPGVLPGLDELWRTHGRLPWSRLVEPALRLAREGVEMLPAHAACLEMLAPVMTMREGGRIYAPGGRLLETGERLEQPGLVRALELVAEEGGGSPSLQEALLALMDERGGLVTAEDLASYRAEWRAPVEIEHHRLTLASREALNSPLPVLQVLTGSDPVTIALALRGANSDGDTTNLAVSDRDGNAVVLTTSLGLGSGDWLPGLDLHLNSMLGEVDLLTEPLEPGDRMQSMMAPSFALDRDGLVLAVGAAGGTRLRTALVGVAAAILDEGIEPQAAVERPRVHPAGDVVNAEPGADEDGLAALEAAGRTVRRWTERHHYFGGVSAIGRTGAAADPRRSGAVAAGPPAA